MACSSYDQWKLNSGREDEEAANPCPLCNAELDIDLENNFASCGCGWRDDDDDDLGICSGCGCLDCACTGG